MGDVRPILTGRVSRASPSRETVPQGPIDLRTVISSAPDGDDGDPLGHSSTGN